MMQSASDDRKSASSTRTPGTPVRSHRRGGALVAMCVSMLVILMALNTGMRERTHYDFHGLSARHAQVQAEYLAQGGLEYLTAWHHRFGENWSPPRIPFPAPVLDPDVQTVLPNRALKWTDASGTIRFRYRVNWDFRKLGSRSVQVGPLIDSTDIDVLGGGNVDFASARFLTWGAQPNDIIELVDTSGPFPDGNQDPVYDQFLAPMVITGNDVRFLTNPRFRTRGLRAGSYLRLRDSNQGFVWRWFRIAAVRSDNTLTLESMRPDGAPDLVNPPFFGHLFVRIYPVRRFQIQTVTSEVRVRLQNLDPDGLGNLADTAARQPGFPAHTDIRIVRPIVDLAAGVTLRVDDIADSFLARSDARRIGVGMWNTDVNGVSPTPAIQLPTDSGRSKRAHPGFAATSAISPGGLSQIHLVRTDLDRFGATGLAQRVETLFNDRDPVISTEDRIVFLRQLSGVFQVCDMDFSGQVVRQLTNEGSDCSSPVITPDGRFVFYAQPALNRIRYFRYGPTAGPGPALPPVSTLLTQVNFERNGSSPNADFGVAPTLHDELAVSPDGKYLAFTASRFNAVQGQARRCLYLFNLVENPPGVFLGPQPELYPFRTEAVLINVPPLLQNITMPSAESQFTPAPPGNPIGVSAANPGWRVELRDANYGGLLRYFYIPPLTAPINATKLRLMNINSDAVGNLANGLHTHIRVYPILSAVQSLAGPPNWYRIHGARFLSHGVAVGDILEVGDSLVRAPHRIQRRFQVIGLAAGDQERIRLQPDDLGGLATGDHHRIRAIRPPGPVYRYTSADHDVSGPSFSLDGQSLVVVERRPWPAAQPPNWVAGEVVSIPLFRTNLIDRFGFNPGVVTPVTIGAGNTATIRIAAGQPQLEAAGIPVEGPNPPPQLELELFDANLGRYRRFEITRVEYPLNLTAPLDDANLYISHRNPDGFGALTSGLHRDFRVFATQSGLHPRPSQVIFPSGHLQDGAGMDNHGTNIPLTNNAVAEAMPRWSPRAAVELRGEEFQELHCMAATGGWNLWKIIVRTKGYNASPLVPTPDPIYGNPNPSAATASLAGVTFVPRPWSWSPTH